jgi:hypothetical protein
MFGVENGSLKHGSPARVCPSLNGGNQLRAVTRNLENAGATCPEGE